MNSIVLMGEILQAPEMRYTPDKLAVTSLLLQFPPSREEDPPYQVRVTLFGELAESAVNQYQVGQQVIVEGQLHINPIERDGRTEKRVEINARRLYPIAGFSGSPTPALSYTPSSQPPLSPPGMDMDELPF